MNWHVVPLESCPAQSWRNGGGTTREPQPTEPFFRSNLVVSERNHGLAQDRRTRSGPVRDQR